MSTNLPTVEPTIPIKKQTFLIAQTNILSQTLTASLEWRKTNNSSNKTPLSPHLVDSALFQLDYILQQHCSRVYTPQATRNVAEQIANSYIRDIEKIREQENGNSYINKEVDLCMFFFGLFTQKLIVSSE